jgi:hypothetical protein
VVDVLGAEDDEAFSTPQKKPRPAAGVGKA